MNNWQALLDPNIKAFMALHENSDVRDLALKKCPNPDWPYPLILDQIKARQKAAIKIPQWLKHEDIIFPSSSTLEQASSIATANYKASLIKGKTFVDLTGGTAIDSYALSQNFESGTIIDADENTAALIKHNIGTLSPKSIKVEHDTAETFVTKMEKVDLALIDPQRRNENRKGLYKLKDCSPNIFELLKNIKAETIILKTSPMLDINQGIEQLGCVEHVHVVELQGECKELLFILKPEKTAENIPITAVKIENDGDVLQSFTYTREAEQDINVKISKPLKNLYEPNPAFMKAGGYKSIADAYTLPKLHPHTHLYTSETHIQDFPGRSFEIIDTYHAQSKAIPFKKANLTVRNFPQDTATLKKKLKLKDGGNDYLFASTIADENTDKNQHIIIHCRKKQL